VTPAKPHSPLTEIAVTIIIPAVILMKFSGEAHLGIVPALLVALAFPLAWGIYQAVRTRKLNGFAVLGVVSTLLTGGIGLFELDAQWLAVKEAAVPGVIGLAVLFSQRTRFPLVRTLLYNPKIIDVEKVQARLQDRGNVQRFEQRLTRANVLLACTFFFSSFMNYVLARWIVTSPAGTQAFNEELGRLTLLSYPMIALPAMAMMMGVLFFLVRGARQLTGLDLSDMLRENP